MNDFQKLVSTFNEIGVNYTVVTSLEDQGTDMASIGLYDNHSWDTCLKIDNGIGYCGFYCEFYFLEGKFQCHGCWE